MSDLAAWPFVARSDEQQRFAAVLTGLGRGSRDPGPSTVALIEGLGGHGKSWLMKRFEEIATGAVQSTPARSARRRAPMVVSLDWEAERVSLMSDSTGPPLGVVLAKLYATILEEVGTARLARRRVIRAFQEFTTALQASPDAPAVTGNGGQEQSQVLAASASMARTGARVVADAAVPAAGTVAEQGVSILAEVVKEDGAKARLADRIAAAVRGEEMLVRAFATGLRKLSRRRPVVLLLDTCEVIGADLQWIRRTSLLTGDNVAWVLAGRFEIPAGGGASDEAAAFRSELPEERVKLIPMLPFDDETVKLLLATARASLTPDDEVAAVELTGGIPIAVYLVAKMLSGGRPIAEVLAPIDAHGDSTALVRGLAERYLKHVRTDPALGVDEHRLYGLALVHDDTLDADILRALWDEDGSMDTSLDELSRRHDFVLTPTRRLHAEVRDTIRSYLLDTARRNDVRAANERARAVLVERIDRIGQAAHEGRLDDETWRDDVLALLWHAFWIDNDDGMALLAEVLPGALISRPAFARDVVGVATFFSSTFAAQQQSALRGCAGLLTFGTFVDRWLALRRTATLKASGPLGRLLDDGSGDDLDAALRLLRDVEGRHAPSLLRRSPKRAGVVALLSARLATDPTTTLEHLEQATRVLPKDGPYAREAIRIATSLRNSLRNGAPGDPAARDHYLRAAVVDAELEAEVDAGGLAAYAIFLAEVPGAGADGADAVFARAVAAEPGNGGLLGSYALFLTGVRHDYDRAEEMYRKAIAADPDDANSLGGYAILLGDIRGDHDRAEEMYEKAIAADPRRAAILGNYALFLQEDRNASDRAAEMFERALAIEPRHANILRNYARFLSEVRKDDARALELFEQALVAEPGNADNLGSYALFLRRVVRDRDRTEAAYERAIAADPEHAENLRSYASFLAEAGEETAARAKELFERAIAANPHDADNLGVYAVFLKRNLRDYDRAQELYERALAVDPHGVVNLGNYAIFMEEVRRDLDGAGELYERALAIEPESADNLGNYASLVQRLEGGGDRARELYERALAVDQSHPINLANYAHFKRLSGDLDGAEELFQRALAADPDRAATHRRYGTFLHEVRQDADRAEEMYRRAVALDPEDIGALAGYAEILRAARDDQMQAEQMYERALALDPDDANLHGNYSRLLLERGADGEAFAAIDRSFALIGAGEEPLRAELWLYRAALGPDEGRADAIASLEALVDAGVRSPGWDLSRVLARARAEGNPHVERLEKLAARLASAD